MKRKLILSIFLCSLKSIFCQDEPVIFLEKNKATIKAIEASYQYIWYLKGNRSDNIRNCGLAQLDNVYTLHEEAYKKGQFYLNVHIDKAFEVASYSLPTRQTRGRKFKAEYVKETFNISEAEYKFSDDSCRSWNCKFIKVPGSCYVNESKRIYCDDCKKREYGLKDKWEYAKYCLGSDKINTDSDCTRYQTSFKKEFTVLKIYQRQMPPLQYGNAVNRKCSFFECFLLGLNRVFESTKNKQLLNGQNHIFNFMMKDLQHLPKSTSYKA